ncbi:MAG: RlmE family RNA methyltransferase [Candidatus Bathyarchaeota archaeon]|nr:RlmE family RNA methyltransferase [Candidatus Bathyarchaeota archaeon]
MPKAWVRERQRDYYYRKAKEEKYRSRAAYKLLEATKKYRFIKSDDIVVDLGAAPGGWMQATRKIVGEKGFVLGVDVRFIEPLGFPNVQTLIGDITNSEILENIRGILPGPADVVISDVSPNISGVWELDHARQIDLAQRSLLIATSIIKTRGNFFVKVFQGDMLKDFVGEVKQHFGFVKLIKPKASRAKSSEIFVLGMYIKRISEQ